MAGTVNTWGLLRSFDSTPSDQFNYQKVFVMFIYILIDHDANEVIAVEQVKQEDVLARLNETPDGHVTYVVNVSGDPDLGEYLKTIDYDSIMEIIETTEREGMLVAKYDNDILE